MLFRSIEQTYHFQCIIARCQLVVLLFMCNIVAKFSFLQITFIMHLFSFVFWMFSWTNLLTRCPVPVFVFCCFCISENFLKKYSRKGLKIHGDHFYPERRDCPKESQRGALGAPALCQARVHPRSRLGGGWSPTAPPRTASLPINCLLP